ncbi:MAG: uracil phosphoribosyltransferase [Halobacteriovoraceae bacterium]|jgi:uracil phosphoribosyltransferase|nr:uracil phosphoribosyltransferase [Halobacteriovoraceae bacterium]MBT5094965.1 uracil phosphoribosyltransferase [Halobacteriovoraceae bacterium]
MARDHSYFAPHHVSEIEHQYGPNVHILSSPYIRTLLAKFGREQIVQPTLNIILESLYAGLMAEVVNHVMPLEEVSWDTRMKGLSEAGTYQGQVIDQSTKVVTVDLARAGIFPSHLCFQNMCTLLEPQNIRQDHFYMQRKVNEQGEVIGVDVAGSKIGGDVEDAVVLFPDPMGATGGSLCYALDYYKKEVVGTPKKMVCMQILITPEFVKRITKEHPEVEIFALRMDRGLSSQEVLDSVPGSNIEQERGLTEIQYIVPGAGGVGEILNNSFV